MGSQCLGEPKVIVSVYLALALPCPPPRIAGVATETPSAWFYGVDLFLAPGARSMYANVILRGLYSDFFEAGGGTGPRKELAK